MKGMTYYTLIKYKYVEKSSEKPAFFSDECG